MPSQEPKDNQEVPQEEPKKASPRKRKTNHKPEASIKITEGLTETTPSGRGNGKPINKYAQKEKIGTPTLGRSPNYVSKPGLGNLQVIHVEGYADSD